MNAAEKAIELHNIGYNCCQAVVCAFAERLGIDEEVLFKATEGFGLGMGAMNCTCGAVSGAVMLAGLKNSGGTSQRTKVATYKLSAKIVDDFTTKNQSVICREIKGVDTGKVLRSCGGCIEDAVKIAEEVLDLKSV
ncbi:MAG: C_GCAxxG_C_C family protein [Spirochaetales bacterium]|nr:C_GCAxxG_C_C family protein [Spirochaetales bacterium]